MTEPYRQLALQTARRMISLLDRRPWSPTYGCFDREYWHYKTLIEFPRANFQAAVWGLALLYKTPFPGNEFAGNPQVLDWIHAALKFWAGMRHADGSLDEWYRNERSFCVTAYTAAAVKETLTLLGEELPGFQKTTDWLAKHPNLEVANQITAALVSVSALKPQVLALQHAEGWFSEYGGADIGYSFLTLDFLARHIGDRDIEAAAGRLLEFLRHFPVTGGEFSSRATNHCFPYGVEKFAAAGNESARQLLSDVRAFQPSADDTYTAYFYFNSYCLAACDVQLPAEPLPRKSDRQKWFPGAGLLVVNNDAYSAVINTRKGVWRASDERGRVYGDAGYVAVGADGRVWASARAAEETSPELGENSVKIRKSFALVDTGLPLRRHVVAFKFVTNLLLNIPALACWFSKLVKRRKINKSTPGSASVTRSWTFKASAIAVEDELQTTGLSVRELLRVSGGAGMHSPSSMLFGSELAKLKGVDVLASEAKALKETGKVTHRSETVFQ